MGKNSLVFAVGGPLTVLLALAMVIYCGDQYDGYDGEIYLLPYLLGWVLLAAGVMASLIGAIAVGVQIARSDEDQ